MTGRSFAGVFVTAIALFVWGFFYWGLNPMPYATWHEASDDASAQAQLRALFPESGTYRVPSVAHPEAELNQLLDAGPAAFVFIDHDPPGMPDPPTFIWGFIQNLSIAAILLILMRFADGWQQRLRFAAWAGLASVAIIDWGDIIWWNLPINWKFQQAIYDFSVWVIGAMVMSPFVPDETPATTD